jgi:hypothetical protein
VQYSGARRLSDSDEQRLGWWITSFVPDQTSFRKPCGSRSCFLADEGRDWPRKRSLPTGLPEWKVTYHRQPAFSFIFQLFNYLWQFFGSPGNELCVNVICVEAQFDFPAEHRVRLRTTNGQERINRELGRRTRAIAPRTRHSCGEKVR